MTYQECWMWFLTYNTIKCIDFLRCSITYPNAKSLFNGLNRFVKLINDNEIPEIYGIMRIKNGFKATKKWKNFNNAAYSDIKFNVIYYDKDTQQSMLVEIQFLISFLLKAKKMGHKYYGIVRRSQFVNSVCNIVYNIDSDYEKYKAKIVSIVNDNDMNRFTKQVFLKPNVILSLINEGNPLLHDIGYSQNHKMFKFFVDSLLHYNSVILDKKNDDDTLTNNEFLKKYLNFNHCNYPIVSDGIFVCCFVLLTLSAACVYVFCCVACVTTSYAGLLCILLDFADSGD